MSSTFPINTVTIMEFSTNFLGGYISDLINIRQFKEGNSYSTQQFKLSKIIERSVIEELHSINPTIKLSNLANELRASNPRLEKNINKDVFVSANTLGPRYTLPIYGSIGSNVKPLDLVKSDLSQAKRTRMYAPPPPTLTPKEKNVTGQTLLITVTFYHSFQWLQRRVCDETVKPHCKESIQFHDGQTLGAVRRAFVCQNMDKEISGDDRHNPHNPFEFSGNKDLKRAMFYINNNIYVDSKPGKIKKNSVAMRKWAQDNSCSFGEVLSVDTKLMDLEVRIGEPYVYQHSGHCEHLFVFNEISFAQPNNLLGFSSYPRIISISKEKFKKCMFCNKSINEIAMVPEEDKAPLRVNHMCEPCFISFNYNNIGEKVKCFKAYRAFKHLK